MRRLAASAAGLALTGSLLLAGALAGPAESLVLDVPTLRLASRCTDGSPSGVDVTATGLTPGRPARVIVETGFESYDVVATGTADPAGRLAVAGRLPTLDLGLHGAVLEEFSGSLWAYRADTTVQVPCPAVAVAPGRIASRPSWLRLQLAAAGYLFGPLPVVFDVDGVRVASAFPDPTGRAAAVAVLPAMPECGTRAVTASQPRAPDSYVTDAQTTLVVTCPTLTATPPAVDAAGLPSPVRVTGDGWDPLTDVQLVVDGGPGPRVTTDKAGSLVADVTVPVRPCGPLPVTGRQVARPPVVTTHVVPAVTDPAAQPEAATTVTVTCPSPSPTPPSTPPSTPTPPTLPSAPPSTPPAPDPGPGPDGGPAATLVVEAVIASGGVGTATGTGFAPGRPVTLTWRLPDGSAAPGTATAVPDAAGRFAVPCLVLPHARLGPRTLQATQPGGRAAAAATLVVAGTMEPGRGRLLGRR